MGNNNVLVSIVVPVYKVEEYLQDCVQSLINQTWDNIEIILVDDGSPDSCGSMIDGFALKDKRIVPVHKQNGGLSSARNEGMKHAHGKYISFVDSDDVVTPYFIEKLINIIEKNDCEIAVCNFDKFINDIPNSLAISNVFQTFTKKEALVEMFKNNSIGWNAWNKMYLRELFSEIEYPLGMICEDKATTYKLVLAANKIGYTHEVLYHYRIRETSISGQHSVQYCFDSITINNQIESDFEKMHDDTLISNAKAYSAKCAFMLYADAYRRVGYEDVMNLCIEELKKKYRYVLKADFIGLHVKSVVYLAGLSALHNCRLINIISFLVMKMKKGL